MLWGAFHSTKNSVNSGLGSEWNRHFPEFHSEILGVPREVGLKFRKIGITGKFCSIRPFLLVPRFSETGNRNSTWLVLKLLNIILVLCQINDWNMLLQRYCSGLAFLPSEIESLVFVRFDLRWNDELEAVMFISWLTECNFTDVFSSYPVSRCTSHATTLFTIYSF